MMSDFLITCLGEEVSINAESGVFGWTKSDLTTDKQKSAWSLNYRTESSWTDIDKMQITGVVEYGLYWYYHWTQDMDNSINNHEGPSTWP